MWVDSCTLDLGAARAAVRTTSKNLSDAIRSAFAHLAVDDPNAPNNFSVAFSRTTTDAHLLFWGGCVAARSFDPHRILRSLVDHLTAHRPPPPGTVWVNALGFVKDGRAVLMPGVFNDDLRVVDRQLRAEGWVAVDGPRALVDLATAELVVTDLIEPDSDALAKAVEGVPQRRAEPTVPHGRYPIDRWVFVDYTGRWGPIGRANATRAAILEIQFGIEHPDPALVGTIASLFATVRAESMFPGYPNATLDSLLDRHPPS